MRTRALAAAVLIVVLAGCGASGGTPAPSGSAAPSAPATTVSTGLGKAEGKALLWPFADAAAVKAWQDAYRAGGTQPWHLDAAETALSFTRGYLGFAEIDTVTSEEAAGDEAWIGVGSRLPNGKPSTAAVVHLVRIGTGKDSPWEVVGTRDSDLAVDIPVYNSPARWPLTIGGTITGVDESLHVRVLSLAGLAGESCCAPAGGQNTRWSVEVPQKTSRTGTLTVVVSTGGHVADVERFAITAVTA